MTHLHIVVFACFTQVPIYTPTHLYEACCIAQDCHPKLTPASTKAHDPASNQCTCTCRLVELMQPIECKINLIMFNPHQGTRFTASHMDQVEAFRAIIMQVVSLSIQDYHASVAAGSSTWTLHYGEWLSKILYTPNCTHTDGLIQQLKACHVGKPLA